MTAVPNVAAVLTPPGVAAIAVVRLSGPLNTAFAAVHLTRMPRRGRCVHCDLFDGGQTIDDILAVAVDDTRLDLNLHGGVYVVRATLDLLQRFGYVLTDAAAAGDLMLDAAGRIERQMLLDLPLASSAEALRLLTTQPDAWRALAEDPSAENVARAVADTALQQLLATPTIAIIGPPNVGKSTLANALFRRDHSITADAPGTTRDWIGEEANLDGLVVRLIDTPGVRQTDDPIEAAAIDLAAPVVRAADLVLIAVDGSVPAGERTASLFAEFPAAVVVRTKADRPQVASNIAAVSVSALLGDGIAALRSHLRNRLGCEDITSAHARCWTPDQRAAVTAAAAGGPPLAAFIASPGVYNRPRPPQKGRPLV